MRGGTRNKGVYGLRLPLDLRQEAIVQASPFNSLKILSIDTDGVLFSWAGIRQGVYRDGESQTYVQVHRVKDWIV